MLASFKTHGLLLEDKVEWLKANTKGIDSSHDALAQHREPGDIIDHFASADPHPKKAYTPWMINRYREGDFRQEDHPRISTALSNFEKYKGKLNNKDINSYKHLSDVEDAVEPHLGTASSGKEEKKIAKEEGAQRVHEGPDGLKVTHVTSHGAACQYGAGTKWCTAGHNDSMFNHYSQKGPLYVVNTPDNRKYQFHFESGQFMNEKDQPEKLGSLAKKYPGLKDVESFKGKHPIFDTKEGVVSKARMGVDYPGGKSAVETDADSGKPVLTPEHLRQFHDAFPDRRGLLTLHPNTPGDVLDKMSMDNTHSSMISRHPNILPQTFKRLADASPNNHITLAGNPAATTENLNYLGSVSKNSAVHENLAKNPKTSPGRLHSYVHEGNNAIAAAHALHNPSVSPDTVREAHRKGIHLGAVASSPSAPEDVLHDIVGREGDSPLVRIPRNIALKNLESRKKGGKK